MKEEMKFMGVFTEVIGKGESKQIGFCSQILVKQICSKAEVFLASFKPKVHFYSQELKPWNTVSHRVMEMLTQPSLQQQEWCHYNLWRTHFGFVRFLNIDCYKFEGALSC